MGEAFGEEGRFAEGGEGGAGEEGVEEVFEEGAGGCTMSGGLGWGTW